MKKFALLFITLLALVGCSEDKIVEPKDLMHHRFILISVNGDEISFTPPPFIEFSEKMSVNGQMCNTFFGFLTLENNKLSSNNLASTEMLCTNEILNNLDTKIIQILGNGAIISLDKNKLILKSDNDELVYLLQDLIN